MFSRIISEDHISPLCIVLVGSMGSIGDNQYRLHQPAAALAELDNIQVYEVHPQARYHDAAVLAADLVVFTMTLDIEIFRLIHHRHQLLRPSICEINDYLPDVQVWNPVHRSWSDWRALHCFEQLLKRCDAAQVSTVALQFRLQEHAQRIEVFPNQLVDLPSPRLLADNFIASPDSPLVLGWGGSYGHLEDLHSISAPLIQFLSQHDNVRFELMGDPQFAEPFSSLPSSKFCFYPAGSLANYLSWLDHLHIGIAPLLPTEYKRCRSDVKFLEYASHSVAPLLQDLDPYHYLTNTEAALLFPNNSEFIDQLTLLLDNPSLWRIIANNAYNLVAKNRILARHIPDRLAFYKQLAAQEIKCSQQPIPLLKLAAEQSLQTLPGMQRLSANHWRLGLDSEAEQQRSYGIELFQHNRIAEAANSFKQALLNDPTDAEACCFLGYCFQKQGLLQEAVNAFEEASVLDPLLSRPVRALARVYRKLGIYFSERATLLNPIGISGKSK